MGLMETCGMPELTRDQIGRWQRLLEAQTGINLAQHEHILREGLPSWLATLGPQADTEQFLRDSENRLALGVGRSLVDYLAVKETRFYRNPAAYRAFSEYLLRRFRAGESRQTVDVWSAGCSTGEEVYTLTMVAAEMLQRAKAEAYIGVIGSDISSAALQVARGARYTARAISHLPAGLRQRYLLPAADGRFEVVPELRRRACFLQSNLLVRNCAPASAMDVIFCHNVLVYFRTWRQREVLNNLAQRLKPGGILLIGPGEASGWSHPALRRIVDGRVQVFMRNGNNN